MGWHHQLTIVPARFRLRYVCLKPVLIPQIERVGYLALRKSRILAVRSSPEHLLGERRTGPGSRRCTASCKKNLLLTDLQAQPAIAPHSCGEGSAVPVDNAHYRQVCFCFEQQHQPSDCCILEGEWTQHYLIAQSLAILCLAKNGLRIYALLLLLNKP